MTVSTTVNRETWNGNGATTSFSFEWKVTDEAHLEVYHIDADDVRTQLTLDVDYSVTLNADQDSNPGGSITYPLSGSALPTGEDLFARRIISLTQPDDLQNQGGFFADVHENLFDRLVMICQQIEEAIDRSILQPIEEAGAELSIPSAADRASKFFGFDEDGNPVAASVVSAALVTSFVETLLDDADADAFWATLMASITKATARSSMGAAGTGDTNTFTAVNTFTKLLKQAQGAAVASANDLALGTDGNYFHVTGTTTINGIGTLTAGTTIVLYFEGALTLTHGGSPGAGYDDLDLPGAANITTAAGDLAVFVQESGVWRCLSYVRGAEKPLVRATSAQMESASSTEAVVTPAVQNQHPAHPKAWCYFDGTPASPVVAAGSAVSSITKNGTGDYTINFSITMSSANYGVDITCDAFGGTNMRAQGAVASRTTTSVRVLVGTSDTGTLQDTALTVTIKGDV